jgi:hypothetical protein
MSPGSSPAYCSFGRGRIDRAYNEVAFRHFLTVDRRRAERSTRSLLLILVTVRHSPGASAKLSDATAVAIFSGLGTCVREVDFVGWYREGHMPAAVLAQGVSARGEVPYWIAERVLASLRARLSSGESSNLHVRVVRLGGRVRM